LARALIKFLDLGLNLALGLDHFVHIIRELSNPPSLLVSFCNRGNSSVPISILQLYYIQFQISRMQLSGIVSESESRLRIQRQNAKRERTRFYRRKKSIFKSGYDLHKQCHAEVYILIRRSGRSYILSCAENDISPFSDQALVLDPCLLSVIHISIDISAESMLPGTPVVLPGRLSNATNGESSRRCIL